MYAVRQEYNYSCCLFNVSQPCQNFPMGKKYERTQSPRPPAGPPADAEEGALLVRALLVQTFDRKDGTGADWRLMATMIDLRGALYGRRPVPVRAPAGTLARAARHAAAAGA